MVVVDAALIALPARGSRTVLSPRTFSVTWTDFPASMSASIAFRYPSTLNSIPHCSTTKIFATLFRGGSEATTARVHRRAQTLHCSPCMQKAAFDLHGG
jgi:hypothetical protein